MSVWSFGQGEGHHSMILELLSFLSPCCQSDIPNQLHHSASGIWSNKVTTPRPSEKEIAQLHWSKKMTVVTEVYKRQGNDILHNVRSVMLYVIQTYECLLWCLQCLEEEKLCLQVNMNFILYFLEL